MWLNEGISTIRRDYNVYIALVLPCEDETELKFWRGFFAQCLSLMRSTSDQRYPDNSIRIRRQFNHRSSRDRRGAVLDIENDIPLCGSSTALYCTDTFIR